MALERYNSQFNIWPFAKKMAIRFLVIRLPGVINNTKLLSDMFLQCFIDPVFTAVTH